MPALIICSASYCFHHLAVFPTFIIYFLSSNINNKLLFPYFYQIKTNASAPLSLAAISGNLCLHCQVGAVQALYTLRSSLLRQSKRWRKRGTSEKKEKRGRGGFCAFYLYAHTSTSPRPPAPNPIIFNLSYTSYTCPIIYLQLRHIDKGGLYTSVVQWSVRLATNLRARVRSLPEQSYRLIQH